VIGGLFARFGIWIALGALVVVSAYAAWTRVQLEFAHSEVASLQSKLGRCKADLAGERAISERQAQAVAELKAKAREIERRVGAAKERIRALRAERDKQLAQIQAAAVPQDCAGAIAWGAAQAQEIAKGWHGDAETEEKR